MGFKCWLKDGSFSEYWKLSLAIKPWSSNVSIRSYSAFALAGLSLKDLIEYEVSFQTFSKFTTESENLISLFKEMEIMASDLCEAHFRCWRFFCWRNSKAWFSKALLNWTTTPVSSAKRYCNSAPFWKFSEIKISIPILFVNDSSARVVNNPPSEISCRAMIQPRCINSWTALNNVANDSISSISGTVWMLEEVTSSKMEPPNLRRSFKNKWYKSFEPCSLNSVVIAIDTFSTGAMAEIIPDKGLFTSNSWSPSFHFVFIDRESFPTGIAIPSFIHMADSASTPNLKA